MNYKIGFIYSILFSMLPSIFMAISVILEKSQYSFSTVMSTLLLWVLLSTFISFIVIVILGIPVVKILNKFNLVNIYNLVAAGGVMGLALSLLFFFDANVQINSIKVIFIVSGLLGGYGFWYGVNIRKR